MLSAFSGDDAMINSYRQGKDLYATLASRIFSNGYWDNMEHFEDGTPNPEGKKRRSKTKRLLLGIMYGMGAASIAVSIDGTVEEAQEIIDNFYKGFPTVKKWMDVSKENAKKYGYVEDIWGRRRRLPDIQLKPYQVEFKDKTKNDGDFNPLLGSLGLVKNDTSKLLDEYYNKAIKTKSRKEVDELASKAEKDGIILHSNSNKIAQAERQCVNARIQGCLSGDTKIFTKEYGIVSIESVSNQELSVWDGKAWTNAVVLPSGKKKKCVINFSNNLTICCSPDHKFKLVDGSFLKCSELSIMDKVLIDDYLIPLVGYTFVCVEQITTTIEEIEMFDVCNTERGYFVANGIVTHNSAATMSKKAMIKVHNDKILNDLDFHMLIAVHDELIGECPAEYADQVAERLTDVMKHAAEPDVIVPFKCDPTIEKSWYYSDYSDVLNEEYQKRIDKGENQKDVLTDIFSSHSECTPEQLCEMLNINADLLDKIMNS